MDSLSPTRRTFLAGAGVALGAPLPDWGSAASQEGATALVQGFQKVPDKAKPWVYWWWVNGNVTEKSITRDLEEMRKKGIGGFLMFDSRAYNDHIMTPPPAPFDFMSDEWRHMIKFAMSEASRLGLEMSTNLSTNGGTLRSPWPTGEDSPKKLIWTSAEVRGPGRVTCELRRPSMAHFWEVAVLAVRRGAPAATPSQASIDLSGQWRDIVFEPQGAIVAGNAVVDLTSRVDASGRLAWDAPEGEWTLLRFGCATMDGFDKDVDILNAKASENHFDKMGRKFLADAGPLAGKTLTHFYNVSWEGASPTWTPGFEKDFLHFRGYSLLPYLPVLAAMTVDSIEVSSRFMEDFGRTLSDCFLTYCYAKLGDLCHQAGLKWHSESGGPWDRTKPLFAYADQFAFWGRNDSPQGEFWHPTANHTNCRRTAMAAHIYGRPLAFSEAFTNMVQHWSDYPAVLKPRGDAAFIDGINHFIWHTFDASPEEFGKPGIVYWAGSHLNPNVTWWQHAGDLLAYLGRCQYLLRQGRFVGDVCVYASDRNYAGWSRDESWSKNASLSLGKGYAYDLVNTEVLLNRMSVKDGSLVLPDGLSYRLLVVDLDEEILPPEALSKIVALAAAGATVVLGQRRPTRVPGLRGAKSRDAELLKLASQLWDGSGTPSTRPLGKGKIISGAVLDEVLRSHGIPPDFAGPFGYIHRHTDEADIYFLSGQGTADCTFRVSGREPELWDAVSGQIRDAVNYRKTDDARTTVPITLPENGSVFVVFRKPAAPKHLLSISGPSDGLEIIGRTGQGAQMRLWRQGKYQLQSSANNRLIVDATEPSSLALPGPWEVRFAPGWGIPESVTFDRLVPWNEHPDEAIKYFSGTAVYRKSFQLDAKRAKRPLRVQLGDVKHVAQVRLNGKPLSVVWTAPWSVDLSGAAKPGTNVLEIEVTNTWMNRLIGDASQPESKWRTKTIVRREPDFKGRYPQCRGYVATDPLTPSGLIGPVELQFGDLRDVKL
ncbi:MAG TPA: glycosyl hydrolase [Bryobacteraceae bacterium]|nr:glycosyl hydrolase [Bryobacteraceae bacterium]HPT25009.1 glycosyl hydrolase [Bryobacteraceae bacterium]